MIVVGFHPDPQALGGIAGDVAFFAGRGERTVLVHGAGPGGPAEVADLLAENKRIAAYLQSPAGVRAAGICGVDGGLLDAAPEGAPLPRGRTELLRVLLQGKFVPVVAAICSSGEGLRSLPLEPAAAGIAVGLAAEALLVLGDERGLLESPREIATLVKAIRRDEIPGFAARFPAWGDRLRIAEAALRSGVGRVVFGDARIPSPVLRALEGHGTVLR